MQGGRKVRGRTTETEVRKIWRHYIAAVKTEKGATIQRKKVLEAKKGKETDLPLQPPEEPDCCYFTFNPVKPFQTSNLSLFCLKRKKNLKNYLVVCVWGGRGMCAAGGRVEVRGHASGLGFLLPLHGFWGLNSGRQVFNLLSHHSCPVIIFEIERVSWIWGLLIPLDWLAGKF